MHKSGFIATFFILALLCACSASTPEAIRPTSTSTYPPTRYVEVLAKAPARDYVEIGVIDVAGDPGSFQSQLLERIKTQAQQLGADAVVVQDVSRRTPVESRYDPVTGTYTQIGGLLVPAYKGIAIKYR